MLDAFWERTEAVLLRPAPDQAGGGDEDEVPDAEKEDEAARKLTAAKVRAVYAAGRVVASQVASPTMLCTLVMTQGPASCALHSSSLLSESACTGGPQWTEGMLYQASKILTQSCDGHGHTTNENIVCASKCHPTNAVFFWAGHRRRGRAAAGGTAGHAPGVCRQGGRGCGAGGAARAQEGRPRGAAQGSHTAMLPSTSESNVL